MVGVRGFEPPASASRTQRSSQTEPHPDLIGKLQAIPEACTHNITSFFSFASRNSKNLTFFYDIHPDFHLKRISAQHIKIHPVFNGV